MQCYHCNNEADVTAEVHCEYGFGLPHCKDCVSECDICHEVFCGMLVQDDSGILYCEECKKESIESFVEHLSEPLAKALSQFGYSMVGERKKDGQLIFEFISQDAPRLEMRIGKKEEE